MAAPCRAVLKSVFFILIEFSYVLNLPGGPGGGGGPRIPGGGGGP